RGNYATFRISCNCDNITSVLQLPLCADHRDSEYAQSTENYPDAYSLLNVSASLLMASFVSATFFNAIKYPSFTLWLAPICPLESSNFLSSLFMPSIRSCCQLTGFSLFDITL